MRFVKAADEEGKASIGTAAMIAYYWGPREVDILTDLVGATIVRQALPASRGFFTTRRAHSSICPCDDEDGTVLWPELMERLDTAPDTARSS